MPHTTTRMFTLATLRHDLSAGMVVFLVALPLCLGVALASGAPLFSGLLAGIIGGLVVGVLSGSHASVSGPAARLTAIVAAQIISLGSFETFLLAVVIAGIIQIVLGIARVGFIAEFVPSSVIKGLLAAIGVILILKQIPHLLGHDADPQGEMAFLQPDHENTFSELIAVVWNVHYGAAVIGILSIVLLILWDKSRRLKDSKVPSSLVVVLLGVSLSWIFQRLGQPWSIEERHLVQVPFANAPAEFLQFLRWPDVSQWKNPAVYIAGITIAGVASLETLLNLDAVDKLDPKQRVSPPSRELLAQGVGNLIAGLIGGIPVTSVIVRSSVNINAGGQTKLSAILHGLLLLVCVMFLPLWLNMIPLSCLAAILLVTGVKLASPTLVKQMWQEGRYQFAPFALTVVAIVMTDLVTGVVLGLLVSLSFILYSNMRRPVSQVVEKHLGGDVVHIQLANQVSFLNRSAIEQALNSVPRGGHVLLDAQDTVYFDPDVLSLLREFKEKTAPVRGVHVSLRGFQPQFQLPDQILYADFSTRELQSHCTPDQALEFLRRGNERFRTGRRLTRDLGRQVHATAVGQYPLAVVLSCIDSRAPVELIFDLGLGDIFGIRIAGNVLSPKVLGSMEYSCAVAGARLILVMGHTRCGAVAASVDLSCSVRTAFETTGCQHLDDIVSDIQLSIDPDAYSHVADMAPDEKARFVDCVARQNVALVLRLIPQQSATLARLLQERQIMLVGAMYDVSTGAIEFLPQESPVPVA
jgi:carbonic anhydrase